MSEQLSVSDTTVEIQTKLDQGATHLRNAPIDEFPDIEFRWFLTRDLSTELDDTHDGRPGTHLITIGMNPAEAIYFGPTRDGGDATCARIYNACHRRKLPDHFYPVSRLSFFNLVPVVDKSPTQSKKKWKQLGSLQPQILEANVGALEALLAVDDNYLVIPAFGVALKRSDWRWEGFRKIAPILLDIPKAETRILSVGKHKHPRGWGANDSLYKAFAPSLKSIEVLAGIR